MESPALRRRFSRVTPRSALSGLVFALALFAGPAGARPEKSQRAPPLSLRATADLALGSLATKNVVRLARFVHPRRGVRFSVYGQPNPRDVRLSAAAIRGAMASQASRVWGTFDGSGEPMRLTFQKFADFLYACDYVNEGAVRVNPSSRADGVEEAPASKTAKRSVEVVEYSCPTDDTRMWSSLRFELEKAQGRWLLVAIVHDGWTI